MEGTNTPERLIIDQEVVTALKNGFDNSETKLLYNKWLDQLEAERTEDSACDIEVSVKRAKVYYRAGYYEEAISDLEETLEGALALQSGGVEFPIEIYAILGKMQDREEI